MNERVINIAYVVAVGIFALAGVIVAAQSGSTGGQNSNQGGAQQNRNANRGGGNTNADRGGNVNANENMNTGDNTNAGQNVNSGNTNLGAGGNANTGAGRGAGGNQNANLSAGTAGQTGTTGQGGALNAADRRFLMTAAMSGLAEVELGRLAVQRGASDAVKQFGQRMVDDHTRANQELMQRASSLGVTLPTALDARHRALVAKMSRLSGAAFDRAYARQMVKDHADAVSLFQREADRGGQADLKAFAAQTLPTLKEHLQMARELAGRGRNSSTNTNSTNSNTSRPNPR